MSKLYSRLSLFVLLASIFCHIGFCTAAATGLYDTQEIYQFPDGTVLENLAVRSDGSVLTTVVSAAEIYLLQPTAKDPNPQLIYRFKGSNAVTGIVETSPDVFYVTVTSVTPDLGAIPNSSQLWRIAFPRRKSDKPSVTKVADLPRISVPNGLTTLPGGKKLLSADSVQGIVFVIDTATGKTIAAFFDPLFDPTTPGSFGVNGVRVFHGTLYFTNGAQNIFGKIPIDSVTGIPLGFASIIARALPGGVYDDFAISPSGDVAYVTTEKGDVIERIDLRTGAQKIVAGEANSTELDGPVSAAFGRKSNGKVDHGVLFVVTSGGQLVRVHIPKRGY